MKLFKIQLVDDSIAIAVEQEGRYLPLDLSLAENVSSLSDILHSPDPLGLARFLMDEESRPWDKNDVILLAPIDQQEVWAAGVTYLRSQVARMEESKAGAWHYDKVYSAPRPELFFKATSGRVSGPGEPVRVRHDSNWSVPEPELTLVISPRKKLVGFTIGNDMSARDIEGENPLYLPQAKIYHQCAALGPCVLIPEEPLDRASTQVVLKIVRHGEQFFQGQTTLDKMVRDFDELITWLGRENNYPQGVFLMTGTGIVPGDDISLENGDQVSIEITGIGTLTNPVVKDSA